MPKKSAYYYRRSIFDRTGNGWVPPRLQPFCSRKAHARNTPPPGSIGQRARGKGWLAGWLGWLGWLAGLAGLGCWQARLGWLAWLAWAGLAGLAGWLVGWLAGWLVHCPAG